jgi:hypothetical protein
MKNSKIKDLSQKYEKAKGRISRQLGSSLRITDNREIIADGCRRIISCDECVVIIDQARNRVTITGGGLKLRNWGSDGVTISGIINSVEFTDTQV